MSFIVPCYGLAHLLRECVDSILQQQYEDLEILIMDDCSPDNTADVAHSFTDARVRYIRNERNLGHLQNYEKGIGLSKGEYVWLISADDKLWRPYAASRLIGALETNPNASFAFCPSVRFHGTNEIDVYGSVGTADRHFSRPSLIEVLVGGNIVSAPAAVARKIYYQRIGGFPQDLPFAGDWYVWARFGLEGDVVYLSEPMVGYRLHDLNMTKAFTTARTKALIRDDIEVRWRILRDVQCLSPALTPVALQWLTMDYKGRIYRYLMEDWPFGMSVDDAIATLRDHAPTSDQERLLLSGIHVAAGDAMSKLARSSEARTAYRKAWAHHRTFRTMAKYVLSCCGAPGRLLRRSIGKLAMLRQGQAVVLPDA